MFQTCKQFLSDSSIKSTQFAVFHWWIYSRSDQKHLTPIKTFWAVLTKKATNWDSEQLVCIIVHNCVVFGAKRIFPVSCGHTAHRDPLWSPALSRPVTWLLLHEMSNLYGADHSSFLSIAKEYQGKFPGSIPRLLISVCFWNVMVLLP